MVILHRSRLVLFTGVAALLALAGLLYGEHQKPVVSPAAIPVVSQSAASLVPPVTSDDHIQGSAKARVQMIEYADLECPYCKTYHPTLQLLTDQYEGQVAWVYRSYPLTIHANAPAEAEAAECVAHISGNDQFWQYIKAIYITTTSNGTGFSLDKLTPLASSIGVSSSSFDNCMANHTYQSLLSSVKQGGDHAEVTGTPTLFLRRDDGKEEMLTGARTYTELRQSLDQLLQ